TLSMRACHPSPVDLKNSTTSGLYRTESSSFLRADFGRPRTARIGTMAWSCSSVKGCASGSAWAAATITASSSGEGSLMAGRFDVFVIVLNLATLGSAQADDSPHLAAIESLAESNSISMIYCSYWKWRPRATELRYDYLRARAY